MTGGCTLAASSSLFPVSLCSMAESSHSTNSVPTKQFGYSISRYLRRRMSHLTD